MRLQTTTTPSTRMLPVRVGGRFYLLFSVFTLLLFPLHESAHYFTYRALGVQLRMTLNTASPADQSQRVAIAELAGPLLNLAVAAGATVVYLRSGRTQDWLAALAVASAMMRLVIYALVIGATLVTGSALSLGNDEPIAARLAGVPSLTFVTVFSIPFIAVVASLLRTFRGSWIRKTGHVLALGLPMMGLGIVIGNILDPWLFPRR
jgi:hypothetical protein